MTSKPSLQFVQMNKEGATVNVRYSCPGRLTPYSQQLMIELRDTARQIADMPNVSVVILSADGPFCSGADLKDENGLFKEEPLLERRHSVRLGPDMCKVWQDIEAFTIAAIEGHCIGGGSALAAAIDYRIMSHSAYMKLPEIALGMNMSWNTLPRLVAQIGPSRTKKYAILCEKIGAQEALEWGLVEEIVEDGQAGARAVEIAQRVAAMPALSVKMTKATVNASAFALVEAIGHMDRDQYLLTESTKEFQSSVKAFSK